VADLQALRPHGCGDAPQRLPFSPAGHHLADGRLLRFVRLQPLGASTSHGQCEPVSVAQMAICETQSQGPLDLYGAIGVKAVVTGHLLVRLAGGVSSSQPNFPADAARSDRQGRPKAVAQRLALDGREHSVKLPQSGDTGVSRPFGSVSTTATLPRGVRQWARASRVTNLYSVDHEGRTMMQSCASAARLRGAGPF
jgi:hypothetical protein